MTAANSGARGHEGEEQLGAYHPRCGTKGASRRTARQRLRRGVAMLRRGVAMLRRGVALLRRGVVMRWSVHSI
jgi:hypothetical protein